MATQDTMQKTDLDSTRSAVRAAAEHEENSRLGQALGRAGTAVGNSVSGLGRRSGDGDGSSAAPQAAAAAALTAAATVAGQRLLRRPRRRIVGIPVPGTQAPRLRIRAKGLARHLPGRG